jgi:uncharacterized phiE125 gp8 family phage protein
VYGLSLITAPASEPITLDRAKLHLRVDHDAEDDLIAGLIIAAREMSESHTGRRWITQEMRLTLADWPCEEVGGVYGAVAIPVDPVASVDAVKYHATTSVGTLTTLATGEYQTWLDHAPPLVAPAPATVWPTVQADRLGAVQIEFTAGYGDADDVPEQVKAAMLLCVAYWYENRGDGVDSTLMNGLPQAMGIPPGAKRLLDSMSNGGYR